MIISSLDESFDSYDKMKTIVNDEKMNVANELFDLIISLKNCHDARSKDLLNCSILVKSSSRYSVFLSSHLK